MGQTATPSGLRPNLSLARNLVRRQVIDLVGLIQRKSRRDRHPVLVRNSIGEGRR
jgi:hypothetical protein